MERVGEVLGDGFMVEVDVFWGGSCCLEEEISWLVVGIGLLFYLITPIGMLHELGVVEVTGRCQK